MCVSDREGTKWLSGATGETLFPALTSPLALILMTRACWRHRMGNTLRWHIQKWCHLLHVRGGLRLAFPHVLVDLTTSKQLKTHQRHIDDLMRSDHSGHIQRCLGPSMTTFSSSVHLNVSWAILIDNLHNWPSLQNNKKKPQLQAKWILVHAKQAVWFPFFSL